VKKRHDAENMSSTITGQPNKKVNPFKGQRCQLVTLGHRGLTNIFNFCHSGTLVLSPECQSARMSEI